MPDKYYTDDDDNQSMSVQSETSSTESDSDQMVSFEDNRNENKEALELKKIMDDSPQTKASQEVQDMADKGEKVKSNETGLPEELKQKMELLHGISLEGVRVHYNSDKPAAIGALAYTEGTNIYLAPGQEAELAHELAHVIQQLKGKVESNDEVNGVEVNNDTQLEEQADDMTDGTISDNDQELESVSMSSTEATIQMREDNPFKQEESHDGIGLTAHHIIGHAKLKEAYALLSDEQKKDILKRSIPQTITGEMLKNVKAGAEFEETDEDGQDAYLAGVRARLVDMNDNDSLAGVDINGVRESFFEWQQGNQYYGPNTGIRAEPTEDKDDMDTDGQYFSDHYADEKDGDTGEVTKQGLGTLGEGLYADLEAHKNGDEDVKATKQTAIYNQLKKILALTADNSNEEFDASTWQEVTDLDQLNSLATNVGLNRNHIKKYAYFKIPQNINGSKEVENYTAIKSQNAGDSEFKYDGVPIGTTPVGDRNIFIKLVDTKGIASVSQQDVSVRDTLGDLDIDIAEDSDNFKATIPQEAIGFINLRGKVARINGYKGVAKFTAKEGDDFTFTGDQLDATLKTDVQGKNLYKYLEEKGAPTSTYLPKTLYNSLELD